MKCEICGSESFTPGFKGRLTNGIPPCCAICRTVERHRIVRRLYAPLRPLLKDWRALQFAPDRSIDQSWFKEYVASSYGSNNSLDMMDTNLPDGRFDIVISNHVLEHVADDRRAVQECFRLVGKQGVVHFTVPTPTYRWKTVDWGFADKNVNEHYRDYGADFPQRIVKAFKGLTCASVVGVDYVTLACDLVYIFSYSEKTLSKLAEIWNQEGVPITHIY